MGSGGWGLVSFFGFGCRGLGISLQPEVRNSEPGNQVNPKLGALNLKGLGFRV